MIHLFRKERRCIFRHLSADIWSRLNSSSAPNWRSKSCRAGAGWGITLVGDRVIPRTGVEGCPTIPLAAVRLRAQIDSQSEAKRRGGMRWGSHPAGPYIPQSINTICHLSWPCPHPPSVLSWTRYSFRRFHTGRQTWLQHLLLNLETNHLRAADWWMVSWKLWRAGSPKSLQRLGVN